MDSGLHGRVALVTGGSRGIGFAIARALGAEGAFVALVARHRAELDEAVDRLGGDDVALALVADLTDVRAVEAAMSEAVSWRGGLNIVVNNAGPPMQSGAIADLPDDPWLTTFGTKAMGAIRVARAAVPHLPDDGTGRVVNVTGITTKSMIPNAGVTGITNAAVAAFTRYLAVELAPRNVLVNAICPGMTLTEGWYQRAATGAEAQNISRDEFFRQMSERVGIVLRRWAEPAEIANVALFLASDLASYVTGQMVVVDGGMSARSVLG